MADLAIDLGQCSREVLGSVLGGVAGGVIGSRIGKGDTRTATTIGGTIIGALIGSSIGRGMYRVDQACVGQVLEQAPPSAHGRMDQPRRRPVPDHAAAYL